MTSQAAGGGAAEESSVAVPDDATPPNSRLGPADAASPPPPPQGAGVPGAAVAPSVLAPIALDVGWTMATLYYPPTAAGRSLSALPTIGQLPVVERVQLDIARLKSLFTRLGEVVPGSSLVEAAAAIEAHWPPAGTERGTAPEMGPLRQELDDLNLLALEALTCCGGNLEVAYEVGRDLWGVSRPAFVAGGASEVTGAVRESLSRRRIATLQRRLKLLEPSLPDDSAGVVAKSLGKWSEFVGVLLGPSGAPAGPLPDSGVKDLISFLFAQGDVWRDFLTGAESTAGLLSPEGAVWAAEAALSRARRLGSRILWHLLPALVVVAAALAGVIYLAQVDLGGAGRVWTEIAAIAGSLGVSAKGVGSTAARLTRQGAIPLFRLEEVEAKAVAMTSLPGVKLSPSAVMRLRRRGVAPSARLTRP